MANAYAEQGPSRLPPSMREEGEGGAVDDETRDSAAKLEAWANSKQRRDRPSSRGVAKGAWEKAQDEALEALGSGEWDGARPIVFVAAYALLHQKVYGVEAAELTSQARLHAAGAAARMLREEFGGEEAEMAEFLRWTWVREKEREAWRRANNRSGGSIGWRWQFNGRLLTEYRLDRARRSGR